MKLVHGWMQKVRLGWLLAGLGVAFSGDLLAGAPAALGDEGMWLFNNPPTKILKEKYGFEPDRAWFEHLQRRACVSTPAAPGRSCRPTDWC